MTPLRNVSAVLCLVFSLLLVAGCGKPPLETIEIEPSSATVTVGQTRQFQARGRDAKGNAVEEVTFTWAVDGDSGRIDAQGLFTAVQPGVVNITAATETKQATASVTVQRQKVAKIAAATTSTDVTVGDRMQVTVTVQSASDQAIADVEVEASATSEGTEIEPAKVTTNAVGQATFTITAAPRVGANQVRFSADEKQTTVVVQGVAGAPAQMHIAAASPEVVAGEEVAVHVTVLDQSSNPVPEVLVHFEPLSEHVTLSAAQATTDPQGRASTIVRASPKVGMNQLRVSVAGLESQDLEIKGVAGNPARVTLQTDSLETVAGGAVTLTVQVQDAHSNPVAAASIQLTVSPADAKLEAAMLTTNDRGAAYVTLHTSSTPGDNEVQATVAALSPASLTAVGQPPVALQILPQTATVAMQGSHRFRALVSDASGHTVEVTPEWKVVGGNGTIDNHGMFTATHLGNDVILATYADLTAGAQLTVAPGQAAGLQVSPPKASLVSGTNQQFQVKAFNAHGYQLDVTPVWEVSGAVGSIDASGLFTATRAGSGEIVVTADRISARLPVTVSPGELTAIVVHPHRAILRAGEELQLEASGRDAAGNTVEIDPAWHLTANLGKLDPSGHFRARHAGEGHVRVEAGDQPVTADIPVKVIPAALARIEVEPQTYTLSAGEELQFTVAGYDAFENRLDIAPQWQLTAEVGSIDAEGKLVARKTGSAKVQATVGEIVGEASVVVKPAPLAVLTLEPADQLNLTAGDTVSFGVVGHDAYGNIVTLTPAWTQSEALGTLTPDGHFRAEKVGTAEIRVQSEGQTAGVRVNISPGKLARIAVSPSDVSVVAGETVSFSATGYDAYDNEVDIQAGWRMVNNLGKIDATGTFNALQAQVGEVIATAAGISGSTQVTVTAGALTHLEVTPHRLELTAGETAQITVVGYDAFGNPVLAIQPVWQVTEGLGAITPDGLLTAHKAGEGRVVAAVQHLAIVVDLQVVRGDLATLRIEPETAHVASGSQQRFTVQGFDAGGNPIPVESTWEVRGGIGTIEANGSFTGIRTGRGTVVAAVGSLQTEVEVLVEPGEVTSLRVTPDSASLVAGDSLQLHGEAFDAAGNRVPTAPVWAVNPDLGTISSAGVFHARRAGSGTIVATIGDVQQTLAIEVQAGQLATIRLLPAKLVISAGGKLQFTATGYDAHGNAVSIEPRWGLEGGIGQIDPGQGTFQAITVGSGTIVAIVDTIAGLASAMVEPGVATRLQLEPQTLAVAAGDEVRVSLTAFDAHDNVTTVEPTWNLTEPLGQLADGRFEAQRVGATEIVATAGSLSARTQVQIQPGPVVRLLVMPQRAQIPAGETYTLRAVGYDDFDNEQEVEGVWQLQGDVGHLESTGVFTAGKQGKGQITARFGELVSQAEVTVVPGTVQRLVITPSQEEVAVTTVQQFTAYGLDAGGNKLQVAVNWAITGDIGAIDQAGNFSASHVGRGHVVAYNGSLMQTVEVGVTPGPVALLFVSPQRTTIPAGETLQFEVQGFDANQNPLPNLQPRWSVVGNIGDIDPANGGFTAQQKGWGKVQATVADVQGSADVLVAHGEADAQQSRMVASRVNILADGKTTADIIVVVRDRYGNPVPEARVTLISSREDRIDQPLPSNQHGVAVGRIRSSTPGQSEINAVVEAGQVSNSLRLTFFHPSASG